MQTSESIAKLAPALLAAKKEFLPAKKTTTNSFFGSKYADLSEVIHATEPALLKHGLIVLQSPTGCPATESIGVVTRIIHESGEWIEGSLELTAIGKGKDGKEKFDAQSSGSSITYARRYGYMGILGIPAEDDDANAVSVKAEVQRASAKPPKPVSAIDAAIERTYIQAEDIPDFDENGQIITGKPITQIAKAGQFDAHGDDAISEKQVWFVTKTLKDAGRLGELPAYLAKSGISELACVPWKGAIFKGLKAWAGIQDVKK